MKRGVICLRIQTKWTSLQKRGDTNTQVKSCDFTSHVTMREIACNSVACNNAELTVYTRT